MRRALLAGSVVLSAIGARPAAAQDDSTFAPLDRAVKRYGAPTTVRGKLEQTLANPQAGTSRHATGELFQDARKRFALRFTTPAADVIVNDGRTLWVYLPSTIPGQVMKLPLQAGGSFDFLTQLLRAPRTAYDVTTRPDSEVAGRRVRIYAMLPKKPGSSPFLRATLWIGLEDDKLWMLETVEPSGLVRRVRFTTMTLGGALPAGVFTFTPPEGARVVDPQTMMAGSGAQPPAATAPASPTKPKKIP